MNKITDCYEYPKVSFSGQKEDGSATGKPALTDTLMPLVKILAMQAAAEFMSANDNEAPGTRRTAR